MLGAEGYTSTFAKKSRSSSLSQMPSLRRDELLCLMDYVPLVATIVLLIVLPARHATDHVSNLPIVLWSCTGTATRLSMPTLLLLLVCEGGIALITIALLLMLSIDFDFLVFSLA